MVIDARNRNAAIAHKESRADPHQPTRFESMRARCIARETIAAVGWLAGFVALVSLPDWSPGWHGVLLFFWLAASIVLLFFGPARARPWVALGAGGLALAPYATVVPRNDRDWAPDHSRAPVIEFAGDRVTIRDFRASPYRDADDSDLAWTACTVDVSTIRTVDYVVEPFSAWRGLAHTFLTFGFADGRHVAVSIEARRERDEGYSPLRGLFRNYEIIYIIGEERDLIGLRANIRRDPVYLFPIDAPPELIRALFVSMLERAHRLETEPDFYNSYSETCTVALLRHVNAVRTDKISGGWRVLLPGYSDQIAWEIGLAGFDGTLEEARARFPINARSAFDPVLDDVGWSREIRMLP